MPACSWATCSTRPSRASFTSTAISSSARHSIRSIPWIWTAMPSPPCCSRTGCMSLPGGTCARNAFSMADPYFNAGVMLIDMAQYRQMDFSAELARLPAEELAQFYYDQDMINFCFRGRILELEPRWNLQNAEPAHEVFNPAVVHYSANPKPWFAWSRVAFKRTYRHLMTNSYYYQYRRERLVRLAKRYLRLS